MPLSSFRYYLMPAFILLLCFISVGANSAIETFEFDNVEQEQVFHDLTKQLRCPKCQNQNISDSNAPLAKDLRNKTYELVKQGKSEQQVVDYMVARFGNFVRYDPPLTPATIFLWLGPLVFIFIGFYFLYGQLKRQNKQDDHLDSQESDRLEQILAGKTSVNKKTKQEKK
ncbi:cytochrome c-type biogenesis protein [Psychromonas aquimarina]|uniref:cytochrome c-type biogenesis protein n=1 Tax=Psychromonas aquimarina TaxID=444919 RepID=UPI00040B73DF|nr:cytochrome c-type biogenesis protein [Psychromonas aquimarina]